MARQNKARAVAATAQRPSPAVQWLAGALAALTVWALVAAQAQAGKVPETFAGLAKDLKPAVVNISTTQEVKGHEGMPRPQVPEGSPFEDFFKKFFEQMPEGPPRKATSLGSGFIIDPEGYVVTNSHVVKKAESVRVILQDDTALDAEVVGRDEKLDVALLKVNTDRDLPSVSFGDSDKARVGDWVLAIGNPFGLGGTVTAGIVSARARDINAGPYDSFIQTDAAINRGHSGGPMFNMDGKVIGVNTAILSPSGGSIGIGFAIPANMAKAAIRDLREYGRVRRAWLGVRIQSVTEEIAGSLGLEEAHGALVADVKEDSPAAEAGLKTGDVVLSFDGRKVPEMRELPRMVAESPIGEPVDVTVWRDGARRTVQVTLGEMPKETAMGESARESRPEPGAPDGRLDDLGLRIAAIDAETRQRFDLSPDASGVVVTDVARGSPAGRKGIRPGDRVLEVNQRSVATPDDVVAQVRRARETGRKSVLFLVQGGRGLRFVALKLPEK